MIPAFPGDLMPIGEAQARIEMRGHIKGQARTVLKGLQDGQVKGEPLIGL